MRKIVNLLTIMILAFGFQVQAQGFKGKVHGVVVDGSTKVVESATITLLKSSDSSVAKISVADQGGNYSFENVPEGKYMVSITAIGHNRGLSEVFEINEANAVVEVKTIELVPTPKSIAGVTVTAKKPLIEQKPGKMVINVDASPTNSGLNALELLEKSPGVSVDNDGNISLKGKQGVMILVDGKPTYMSGPDLTALLKSMQSSNLDQIEVMTNPPAKYDAAGNSGIINIKTKKGIVRGMNGNANAGYTQGLYARFNGGFNLNYRNDKLNLFGGYNGGTYEGYNNLQIFRNLYEADKTTLARVSDQLSRPHFKGNYHNLKAGMDYNFSKKNVAGIVVNAGFNDNDEDPTSNSTIRAANGDFISKLNSFAKNDRSSFNLTTNLNFKHTFDSTGRELTADVDYAFYDNKSNTLLNTQGLFETGEKQGDLVMLKGYIPSVINIYSAKMDYVHPFKNGLKMEAGWKSSIVKTDNEVGYQRNSDGGWIADDRTNHFVYDENINAAYVIFSKTMKKWELTAGLRAENTNAKGHQFSNDSTFKRDYTNLFPNAGLGFNANEKNQFNFSYSRRVSRPDYDDLNPFVYFLDSLTYGQGNPYLQPQFTNNFELSHTFHRFLTTTLNYSRTTDIITELLRQNTEKNITFQTKENFSSMNQVGIAVMANFPITKWWNSNVYVNVFNNHFEGLYNNDPLNFRVTSFMANTTQSFTFAKVWSAELSGWYRSKSLEGILNTNDMGAVNFGLSRQLLKKKANIKLGVRDIFYTQQFSGYAKYSDVDVTIKSKRDSRQVNLTFTYRFGKTNIAPERRRNSGASDEQNRVKSGGN